MTEHNQTIAERNRALKKLLLKAFGAGKVRVRGSRGTAYGWVTCDIAYAPRDWSEAKALEAKVMRLIAVAGIKIGTYGTPGDMGADYGWGSKIHVNFEPCRDRRVA